jgi:hypothetical protein
VRVQPVLDMRKTLRGVFGQRPACLHRRIGQRCR